MIKNQEDKSLKTGLTEKDKRAIIKPEEEFFFPEYGITVKAISKEEAERKVKELTNKDKEKI